MSKSDDIVFVSEFLSAFYLHLFEVYNITAISQLMMFFNSITVFCSHSCCHFFVLLEIYFFPNVRTKNSVHEIFFHSILNSAFLLGLKFFDLREPISLDNPSGRRQLEFFLCVTRLHDSNYSFINHHNSLENNRSQGIEKHLFLSLFSYFVSTSNMRGTCCTRMFSGLKFPISSFVSLAV